MTVFACDHPVIAWPLDDVLAGGPMPLTCVRITSVVSLQIVRLTRQDPQRSCQPVSVSVDLSGSACDHPVITDEGRHRADLTSVQWVR